MAFTAGQKIRAFELNRIGAVVGRNQRTTNATGISAIARVLSTTAPVVAGRTYRVHLHAEVFSSSGAATSQNELRYTTNNTEPTTTSTILTRGVIRHDSTTSVPDEFEITGYFAAVSTGTFRVAWCLQRVVGAVNVNCSADANFPATLTVEDVGDTVATTGTVY